MAEMLFRVAAGPRIGFGHLVRVVALGRALDVRPLVALRGGGAARRVARRLGCGLVDGPPQVALRRHRPSVLVVDEPHAATARGWIRAARTRGVPIAAIRDRGIGVQGVDLAIDGSVCPRSTRRDRQTLLGPRFMVLDPEFGARRRRRRRPVRDAGVAIMLGGGAHAGFGDAVAALLERELGASRVTVAPGFMTGRSSPATGVATRAAHARWLASARVAVVGGGVGLYEVSCLGIPAVAVAVTPPQRATIRAFVAHGAAVDGGSFPCRRDSAEGRVVRTLAGRVLRLLNDPRACTRAGSRAQRLVDGRGGERVAGALRALAGRSDIIQDGGVA